MHTQFRQFVAFILVSQADRVIQNDGPPGHPVPETFLRMAFQPPLRRFAAVMDKEHAEHFRPGHDAQEFGMIA